MGEDYKMNKEGKLKDYKQLTDEIQIVKSKLHELYLSRYDLGSKERYKFRWKELKSNPIKYKERLEKHKKENENWRKKHPDYSKVYCRKYRKDKLNETKERK